MEVRHYCRLSAYQESLGLPGGCLCSPPVSLSCTEGASTLARRLEVLHFLETPSGTRDLPIFVLSLRR